MLAKLIPSERIHSRAWDWRWRRQHFAQDWRIEPCFGILTHAVEHSHNRAWNGEQYVEQSSETGLVRTDDDGSQFRTPATTARSLSVASNAMDAAARFMIPP